ncbi:MAG: hypothetical protein ACTSXZ_10930 [Alphaproteobacteria bacterium]
MFEGDWDGKLSHSPIVKNIDADGKATAYYGYGKYAAWNAWGPKCIQMQGAIESVGKLVPRSQYMVVEYEFTGDNTLKGKYSSQWVVVPGTFTRTK